MKQHEQHEGDPLVLPALSRPNNNTRRGSFLNRRDNQPPMIHATQVVMLGGKRGAMGMNEEDGESCRAE